MYKLTPIGLLDENWQPVTNDDPAYLAWLAAGNVPDKDGFPTAAQLARQAEIAQAPLTARQYFMASSAAMAFIRLTPAEQATAIDGYSTAQIKVLLKYLTVAVSALIKREFLNGG